MCFPHPVSLTEKNKRQWCLVFVAVRVRCPWQSEVQRDPHPYFIYSLALELKYFESVSVDLSLCHNKDFSLSGVFF